MVRQLPPHKLSIALEEYKEVGTNLRHYGNMRFAQLTLFVAISGGLLAAIFAKDSSLSFCQKVVVEFLGLLLAAAFFVIEKSAIQWWNRYYDRAKALENILGMRQYSLHRPLRFINATNAVLLIYSVAGCVWLALLAVTFARLTCYA